LRYKKFEGDKLYFSPIDVNDLEIFTDWMSDETVIRGLGSSNKNLTEMSEKNYLEKIASNPNSHQFSIILKANDKLIGTYSLHEIDFLNGFCLVGGFIGDIEDRNKGYGTEALTMICDYAFNVLNIKNIVGQVYSFNKPSIKSYEKVGFKLAGTIIKNYFYRGNYHDEYYYQMSREDFYKDHKTFVKPLPE